MNKTNKQTLQVELEDNNLRIDFFIAKKLENLSRSKVKESILNNRVLLNGSIINDPSKKVLFKNKIIIKTEKIKKLSLKPYNYNLNILYEDKDFLIINKESGISIHPGPGNYDNTIVNALIHYNKSLSDIGDEFRPGIVHRIDKDTSGVIVIAKNNLAHEYISKQFSKHSITRVYHALIWGKLRPSSGIIETLISRSSKNRQMMDISSSKGKQAITKYRTLEIFEGVNIPTFSLIECKLETGRTHQIRVHMKYKGNNIVGDKKYKKKFKKFKNIDSNIEKNILNLQRQFLHAKTLGFIHPRTEKKVIFSSILPQELNNILKMLRNIKK